MIRSKITIMREGDVNVALSLPEIKKCRVMWRSAKNANSFCRAFYFNNEWCERSERFLGLFLIL